MLGLPLTGNATTIKYCNVEQGVVSFGITGVKLAAAGKLVAAVVSGASIPACTYVQHILRFKDMNTVSVHVLVCVIELVACSA